MRLKQNDNFKLFIYILWFALAFLILLLCFGIQGEANEIVGDFSKTVVYQRNTIPCPKVWDIIECESGGNPQAQNPYSTAYGLCQFLDSTWQYVQNKWDMVLGRDDPADQLYACKRLLWEEGISHWQASAKCHSY